MVGAEGFIKAPSEEFLDQCTREQLVKIPDHGLFPGLQCERLLVQTMHYPLAGLSPTGIIGHVCRDRGMSD